MRREAARLAVVSVVVPQTSALKTKKYSLVLASTVGPDCF